ncbi:hypothetical protein JANAI62_24200 [Jannaschia pagri]|uniref:DUF192 domain-containing protein n=1 Tax=Jannaschia pagri TaxID=2829797 RepID=A0ABQ4NN17_9RHOB|nr:MULTISPECIES: DUF192 domain-containing protein [unclassified Jannaschia]GIT91963.1 hypothetical protein JANAI61_24210 [Jannaschia sp. AI_61]GIT95797.1 hypothetical protein JANAI62_24200 [Jannaschia sp. AI_62]
MGILPGLRTLLLCVAVLWAAPLWAACADNRVDLRGDWGSARFQAELALTPEDHARGLMFRESMPRMAGMLFVYEKTQPLGFWMRNTLIPLDMIFLDATGTVVNVHANAQPLDETVILSDGPARAVLEINGGMAERLGIKAGDQLRSPAMPQNEAAWGCE